MASARIVENGYIENGLGQRVKHSCRVVFIKDDLSESAEQYYECDFHNDDFETLNSELQKSADEYNSRA